VRGCILHSKITGLPFAKLYSYSNRVSPYTPL
jgi:hypothetical protein